MQFCCLFIYIKHHDWCPGLIGLLNSNQYIYQIVFPELQSMLAQQQLLLLLLLPMIGFFNWSFFYLLHVQTPDLVANPEVPRYSGGLERAVNQLLHSCLFHLHSPR